MKVVVKATAIAADSHVVLPRGVVYINEEDQPRLANRVAKLVVKYPQDIELYTGDAEGFDIMASREKDAEVAEDKAVLEVLKKAKELEKKKEKAKAAPSEKVDPNAAKASGPVDKNTAPTPAPQEPNKSDAQAENTASKKASAPQNRA